MYSTILHISILSIFILYSFFPLYLALMNHSFDIVGVLIFTNTFIWITFYSDDIHISRMTFLEMQYEHFRYLWNCKDTKKVWNLRYFRHRIWCIIYFTNCILINVFLKFPQIFRACNFSIIMHNLLRLGGSTYYKI